MVTRYDVDFVAEAIKESKPIICVACEKRFEIVLQKNKRRRTRRSPDKATASAFPRSLAVYRVVFVDHPVDPPCG